MNGRMIFLGFGKWVRADKIYALQPITGENRGGGQRTLVWVEGVADPIVASRTERTILHDMGHDAATSPLLDEATRRERLRPLAERYLIARSFVAARNTTPDGGLRVPARVIIVVTRTVPELVLAILFLRLFGLGAIGGILALGIHSVGMIGKLYADAIEDTDPGPRDALRAAGATWWQQITGGVLPQAMPAFIATAHRRGYRFIAPVTEPTYLDDEIAVIGLNTARRWAPELDWSHGRISRSQIARTEARLAALPELPAVGHQPVVDELTALLARYQACIFEHRQMLRHRRFRHLEPGGDLAGAELGVRQIGQDLPPGRRGERFENLLHRSYLRIELTA